MKAILPTDTDTDSNYEFRAIQSPPPNPIRKRGDSRRGDHVIIVDESYNHTQEPELHWKTRQLRRKDIEKDSSEYLVRVYYVVYIFESVSLFRIKARLDWW